MSSLVSYEPLVDSTTAYFLKRTQEVFADSGQVCDFTHWLQFYAFDVVGELTWSKRLGFLEKNEDVGGIVAFLGEFLSYVGPVSNPFSGLRVFLILLSSFLLLSFSHIVGWTDAFPGFASSQKPNQALGPKVRNLQDRVSRHSIRNAPEFGT